MSTPRILLLALVVAVVALPACRRDASPTKSDGSAAPEGNASGKASTVTPTAGGEATKGNSPASKADDKPLKKDGPGDPALTYEVVSKATAKHRGERVTWAFAPLSAENNRMMCALDMKDAMGPQHHGIYVVEFASAQEAGDVFNSAAFQAGSTITGTLAGDVDQFLVTRAPDGTPQKDIPKVTVPLLKYPVYAGATSQKGKG